MFFSAQTLKHECWPKSVWPKSATTILAQVGQLRLAKVGQLWLAKVGQLRLAKVGQNFVAKVGLAKIGKIRMAKVGLAKVGSAKVGHSQQGAPLMPMLFTLGQHRALEAVPNCLRDGEKLFVFIDDVYLVCTPGLTIVEEELVAHAHISLHLGKTQVWNQSGEVPAGIEAISRAARLVKPDAIVGRGMRSPLLPSKVFEFARSSWWRIWKATHENTRFCFNGSWRSMTPKRVGCAF